ncbi:Major allergen Pru ar like [Actinidia chinensis var. chinensis]|uniref:Major allergen Pru ar like n=1 Tax=Actinidia chinensis var. chinensis TaxID=1590841 RepID=A0A2R6PJQ6_ACTCC|nr:Major allergen Pru ar like [Actinidia chinensis var. chinensis]
MAAIIYDMEIPSSIPADKMFKAFVLDGDTILPKVLPHAITSVQTLEGDGGVGTIKLTTFGEGSVHKSVKHRVDGLDKENFTYSYTIIEGGALDVFETISYHIKIVATPDGGSICKNRSIYKPKCDAQVSEEEIKAGKERASGIFKKVEAYLLANPDTY